MGITGGNSSPHMHRLTGAGYVEERKESAGGKPRTRYTFADAGRKAFEGCRKAILTALEGRAGRPPANTIA